MDGWMDGWMYVWMDGWIGGIVRRENIYRFLQLNTAC